eukprot:m.106632 g.106632  ORF g.106632 m.106632 type:complete len:306 (+) comp27739_c0_seq1:132-1049(+)
MADQRRTPNQQLTHLPGPGELIGIAASKLLKSPKALSFLSLWIFGLFCMLYATPPFTLTDEMREEFQEKLEMSNTVPGYQDTFEDLMNVQDSLYRHKTWFWSFNAERSEIVYSLEAEAKALGQQFAALEAERTGLRRDAFQVVGLFSEYGVQEARQLFWDCLDKGKGFARRSTFYDMLFGLVMGRDENLGAFVVRVLLNFLINATMGLIGVVFAFIYYLYIMVFAYKASFLGGLAFFLVAGVAGLSMALLYMFLLYGVVGGTGYVILKTAVDNSIESNRRRQQQQPIQYQQQQRQYQQQQRSKYE